MTTPPIMSVTDELIAELDYAANLDSAIRITVRADYLRALLSERAELKRENERMSKEIDALRHALTYIRDTSDDWHVCEKAADALIDAAMTP